MKTSGDQDALIMEMKNCGAFKGPSHEMPGSGKFKRTWDTGLLTLLHSCGETGDCKEDPA